MRQQAIRERCFHPTGTFVPFPRAEIEGSVVARFERQVGRYPDGLAVKAPGRQLTYAELDAAANRVANALLARRGTGAEPIALLVPKTAALVVGVLGVLKAGKIYVLLDPAQPAARLAHVLRDCGADFVLVDAGCLAMAAELGSVARVAGIGELEREGAAGDPGVRVDADDLAYVLYTSGSTGAPKGIAESHRNVLHYIMTETNDLRLCAEDRLTFLASQGRDVFRALLNGGAVLPVDVKQRGLAGLADLIAHEGITIYNSVASTFREFASGLGGERFPRLRLIKVMGEALYPRDVELYRRHFAPPCVLINWYGPNEVGIVTRYFIDHDTAVAGATVPVGHAVPDKLVRLRAEDGGAAAPGALGEITVASAYLSPGYWRAPELTAAAFRPDAGAAGSRVYRTGDIGVMSADGCLTVLGRVDHQVKVRGFRVEIAEVEAALLALETVREAVVVRRDDGPAHDPRRLVAYVVPARRPGPTVSELRAALAVTLPDYMVPTAFVEMERLPVIGIGKVDRQRLPAPGRARPALAEPYAAPRTPVEHELARIWADVLDLDAVGVDDLFVDLGGHSLLAAKIASQVQAAFGVEVSAVRLLAAPTVASMGGVVVQHLADAADPARVADWLERASGA